MSQQLERTFTAFDGIATIVGITIGTGIFASPGVIVNQVGQVGVSLLVWVIGGALAMLGGLCFAELATAIPSSGGAYAYLMELHGVIGFSYIWASFFCLKSASLSIIALIFARYMGSVLLPDIDLTSDLDSDYRIKLLATAALIGSASLNIIGVDWVAKAQKIFFFFKIAAIVLMCIMGVYSVVFGTTQEIAATNFANIFYAPPLESLDAFTCFTYLANVGSAVIAALWAYDGFDNLNCVAEEVINPQRNMPISIITGMSIVLVCYVFINIAYFLVLPLGVFMESQAVAVTVAQNVWGYWAALLMALLVSISALGSLVVSTFSGARVFYAAGKDKIIPFSGLLELVSKDFKTPYVAIIVEVAAAVIMLIPGNFGSLVNYFGFTAWIFYGLCAVSLMWVRKKPHLDASFKVRPYPLIPIIFILSALGVIISSFVAYPLPTVFATLFVLSGLPIFYLFFWRGNLLKLLYIKYTAPPQFT